MLKYRELYEGRVSIRFGTYNIWNGQNRVL